MKRSISSLGLLLTSISAIIGSGWLFGAFYTSTYAGPAALLAWVLGAALIMVIAFVFAELAAMLPITGSSTRIPHFTHGAVTSYSFAWVIWLCYMVTCPAEVQAVVQYLAFYIPALTYSTGALTKTGYIGATVLMLGISILNTYSLRWLIRLNSFLTALKILIPLFMCIVILAFYFTPEHVIHPNHSAFMPMGFSGVFSALSMGGIVYSFNGFKQAAEMAGEARNPKFAMPFAIIGSIVIAGLVYVLLQIAFFSSIDSSNLTQGWAHLHLSGALSPFADILKQDNLGWVTPILMIGAIVGPLGAGMMYCASAGRSLYGMSKNGYMPPIFIRLSTQGTPIAAIAINFILGMLMFAPLPGWDAMASFLTSLMAITYTIGPITLIALRRQLPDRPRPFKLPFADVWCYVAFCICALLTYWCGWDIIKKLGIAMLIALLILAIYQVSSARMRARKMHWKQSAWLWIYFAGMCLISYLGTFGNGLGILNVGVSIIVIMIFSLFICWFACKCRIPQTHLTARKF